MQSATNAQAKYTAPNLVKPTPQTDTSLGHRAQAWRRLLVSLTLIFSDVLFALVVWGGTTILYNVWGREPLSAATVTGFLPSVAVWVGLRALLGLYPGYGLNQVEELRRQTYAVLTTLAITATFALALQVGNQVSRLVLALGFLGILLFAPLTRQLVKWVLMKAGLWGKPVIVFSSGEPGGRVATLLTREWGLGYKPVAVFGGQPAPTRRRYEETPDEKTMADAVLLSRQYGIDTAIFAMPHTRREHLARLVDWASFCFRHVTVIPNLEGIANSAVVARDFAGVFGVEIKHNLLNPSVRRIKRALDFVLTVVGGIVVLPLLLALCLLVRLESRGPVLYRAQRLGRDGKPFQCVKFRTMVPDAEILLERMLEEDPELREEYLRYHKLREDPRVTRVGRFLRKTSLDELPQLWNVLKGEMSLVGPRPYLPRETDQVGVTQSEILRVYPGITGPWQVGGRSHTTFGERIRIDAYYVRNWSIWLDIVILARTVRALIARTAY